MAEVIHVVPVNDLAPHDSNNGRKCVCSPRAQSVQGGVIIVHNSFDGRELWEESPEPDVLEPYSSIDIDFCQSMLAALPWSEDRVVARG